MNGNQRGSETAPISTQSQDPAPHGVCTCPPPRGLDSCNCGWGTMIKTLIYAGYRQPASQAARDLLGLADLAQRHILEQRRLVYERLAAAHRGTMTEFLIEHQMSRAVFYRLGLRVKDQ